MGKVSAFLVGIACCVGFSVSLRYVPMPWLPGAPPDCCRVAGSYRMFMDRGAAVAVALLLLALANDGNVRQGLWAAFARRWATPAAALAVGAAMVVWCVHFGRISFAAFDMSVIVDSLWRGYLGQVPYRDFLTTQSPGFYLPLVWASHLTGPTWNTTVWLLGLVSAGTFFWLLAGLLALNLRAPVALSAAAATVAIAIFPSTFWWYNSLTAVAACVLAVTGEACRQRPDLRGRFVALTVALWWCFLLKPTMVVPTILAVLAALFADPRARPPALLALAAAMLATIGLLGVHHIEAGSVVDAYLLVAQRAVGAQFVDAHASTAELVETLLLYVVAAVALAPSVVAAVLAVRRAFAPKSALLIPASLIWGAAWGLGTNRDHKYSELAMIGLAALLLPVVTHASGEWRRRGVLAALVFASAVAAWTGVPGAYRVRLRSDWYNEFFTWEVESRVRHDGRFFDGMRGSRSLHATLDELLEVRRRYPGARMFFGPKMEFSYAFLRAQSPLHLPLWWHLGTSFPATSAAARELTRAWLAARFDVVVFYVNSDLPIPTSIQRYVGRCFLLDRGPHPHMQVWIRRAECR